MNKLGIRVLSGVLAASLLIASYLFAQTSGLILVGILVCCAGIVEYSALSFKGFASFEFVRKFFILCCATLMFITILKNTTIIHIWGLIIALYASTILWLLHEKLSRQELLTIINISGLGFFYCGLLPALSIKIITLPDGESWFLLLLTIVFFGDTFAYFAGQFWGEKKLAPSLSPNKTLTGAVGGLLGSLIAAALVWYYFFPAASLHLFLISAVIANFLAQTGDLFESLLKRVADVKDSGKIMPGHGGVLDRIDGVLFAAPVIYTLGLMTTAG